ncbi:nudix hydrolase [Nannochloropsis gaditana]|uniref:Nudix hydrolase n=1 Tax=Nannochloropsis gaditana TaxID=72520 RepID=W7TQW3_9STRA|nr:nudix hydrolase [Nannochloropsis gaditana]
MLDRHKRLFAKDFLVRYPSVSSSPLATLCPVVPAPKETEEQSFEFPTPPQTASWINPAYMRLENSNMSLTSSSSCSTCSLPPASSTSALGAAPLRRRRRVNGVGAAAFLLGLLVGGAHAFVPAYHRKLAAAAPCAAANNKRRAGGMSGHQSVTMSAVARDSHTASVPAPPTPHTHAPHTPSPGSVAPPEQPIINQYPVFPRAAVNIVVVRARPLNMGREYLFVQRSKEPGTNQWALPGGSVEIGEEMLQAAAREVVEETTLDHTTLQFYPRCFMTTDAIYNDDMGAVKYHFVISHMVCWAAPEAAPVAADDAKDIRWMTLPQLRTLDPEAIFRGVVEVVETVERLVDVGCITKADLVRVPVAPDGSMLPSLPPTPPGMGLDDDAQGANDLIPRRM